MKAIRKQSAKTSGLAFSFVILLVSLIVAPAAMGQQEFTDPSNTYKLMLVGDWKGVTYNDAVGRQKTEFVYRDRSEGLLRISKESLNGPLSEMVKQEEENLRVYRSGFASSATEPFGGGTLKGIRLSFFSTEGPRKVSNTYYYLEDKGAAWVLRFSGKRGSLETIRNLTDQIARSFKPL
jgi:hypothetical protein